MPEYSTDPWMPSHVRSESGSNALRTRQRRVEPYNAFLGASQGSAGTTGSSNLEPWALLRVPKAEAVLTLDGVGGISFIFSWINLEPMPPVAGVHTYEWASVDFALMEMVRYPGAKCFLRVNSGGPSAPNWIMGGATNRLSTDVSSGSSIALASGPAPIAGSSQIYLDGYPGQQEGPFTTVAGGSTFTIVGGPVTNLHKAGGIVEWQNAPAAWVNNQAGGWKSGDMIISPVGSTNALGLVGGNLVYVTTVDIAQTSYGTGTSVAANWTLFLAANNLIEVVQFASGDWMPVTWDANYQSHRFEFIKAFGARYNGHPLIDKIQMAGAGYLGEMTLHSADSAIQTISSWLVHGYNDWTYIDVWKAFIDQFDLAFPNHGLCLDVDEPFGGFGPGGSAWASAVAPAAACGTHTSASVDCTATTYSPRTDTVSGVTNENASVTDATIAAADSGKRITGLTGITADRFVGTVTVGTSFLISTSRFVQITPASNVISGTSATLTNDIQTGMLVSGTDIPANSYVGFVTLNTKFTLSAGQGVSGTITAAAAGSMTDSNASWTPSQWVGWKVYSGAAGVSTGTITANTATGLTVTWAGGTPTAGMLYSIAQDRSATGTTAGITLTFNSTSRAITTGTLTAENIAITCTTITLADRGKLITGGGMSTLRYVGTVIPGVSFLVSTLKYAQNAPSAGSLSGTTLTIAFDGNAYNTPAATGGIVRKAICGSNQSGTLTSDVYGGGTAVAGWLAANHPFRVFLQQNGLASTDLNTLQVSRYRQLISNAVGTTNSVLLLAGGGYQPHNGGNSVGNINSMLKVTFDDNCSYIELYANDVVTGASDVALFAGNTRP